VYYRFASERPRAAGRPASVREALSLFRYRVMWVIGGIQFVRFFVALAIAVWLPTYLVAERGYSLQQAGVLTGAAAICTMLSNFAGGYVSDRLQNPLAVIGGSLTVLAVSTTAIVAVPSSWMLVLAVCVNASFVQFYFGPLFAVPAEMLGARRAGISSGFSNFFANVGGAASTFGMGQIKDATGSFTLGFMTIAAVCVLGLLLTAYLAVIKRHWTPPAE
jgi:sugar phosphate permease